MRAADLPFLTRIPLAERHRIWLESKASQGKHVRPRKRDRICHRPSLSLPERRTLSQSAIITSYGFGVVIRNLIGIPIKYGTGHQEDWPRKVIVGTSLEFLDQVILAMDVTSEKSVHLGVDWTPVSAVCFRTGLKNDGIWMWSLGMGARFRNFVFDLAVVLHPYLNSQLRGSLTMNW